MMEKINIQRGEKKREGEFKVREIERDTFSFLSPNSEQNICIDIYIKKKNLPLSDSDSCSVPAQTLSRPQMSPARANIN